MTSAGDRELLLLAARQVAAAPPQHVLEHREQLDALGVKARRILLVVRG